MQCDHVFVKLLNSSFVWYCLSLLIKPSSVTIFGNVTEQFFHVVLFVL